MLLLGQIGLWGGVIASFAAVLLFLFGKGEDSLALSARRSGYYATFLSLLLFTVCIVVLLAAFLTKNYTFAYVAQNHPTDTSSLAWLYRVSGLWAGQEGSLLVWAWIITLFTGFMALKGAPKNDNLNGMALMVLNIIVVVFGGFMLLTQGGANNPFTATPAAYLVNGQLVGMASGWGMNPLLQHWAMILHPPALFIGYAGLSVPFAYAIAALIVNDDSSRWVHECDRTTIFAWLFLTCGIALGAIWAYVVLGWGGFWGWDPVENASILPWFVGVALIHSFTMYRRKGSFKKWTVMLSAITFFMVILGTWVTRSGLITNSVHTFGSTIDAPVAYTFGALMVVALLVTIIGVVYRKDSFRDTTTIESLTSKEAGYYFNNLFMVLSSIIIALMTTSTWWLKQTYPTTSFETIAHYMGIIYIAVMAICPLLKWTKTGGRALWDHIMLPLLISLVPFALLVWEWYQNLRPAYTFMVSQGGDMASNLTVFGPRWLYDATALVGLFLACFLIVNTAFVIIGGARQRSAGTGSSFGSSLGWVMSKARTQSGGMLVHISIGIIVIGLVGSVMYVREVKQTIPATPGSTFAIADYTFTVKNSTTTTATNGDTTDTVNLDLKKGSTELGTVSPSVVTRAATQQANPHAVVKSDALKDLFIALDSHNHDSTATSTSGDTLTMDVRINPLIRFLWIGIGLMMVGITVADWPKKKKPIVAAAAPEPVGGKKNGK